MSTTKNRSKRPKVGDWVAFRYGTGDMFGQVVEARGPIGVNRRRLYDIHVMRDNQEPDFFELPEEALSPVPPPPSKVAVMNYLKKGGLLTILRSNIGGKIQPKIWLRYDPTGNVTFTFQAGRGLIGGATVPCLAFHENKVFTAKQEEVLSFLASFGLNRAEAQEVVAAVGTAP